MKKILICIDQTVHSAKVASEGISIAKSMNAEISFIHVIDTQIDEKARKSLQEPLEKKKTKARRFLENILSINACAALIYIDEGTPANRIIEKAKTLEVDLIVLGNENAAKIPGNVAKIVTKNVKNPVLII